MPSKINLKDKVEDGEIDLSLCDLQDVPVREISLIAKAHSLDLSNNHLSLLPKNFGVLTNIVKLDLSKNQLKELPENFGNLLKLKHLDLYKNQLQHLPLSFSKLKALRWLDLKDNPLVSAIQDVAGPCLDSKQCQSCAKDIVQFYTNLEGTVNKEREAREKQRQKDKLANELANQKLKQQEKKMKKKEKNKKKDSDESEVSANQEVQPVQNVKIADVKVVKSTSCFVWLLKLTMFLTFFMTFLLFALTSIKYKNTQVFEEKIINTWGNLVSNLPASMQPYGYKSGFYFRSIHEMTGRGLFALGEKFVSFRDSDTFQNLLNNMNSAFNTSIHELNRYYNTLFTKSKLE